MEGAHRHASCTAAAWATRWGSSLHGRRRHHVPAAERRKEDAIDHPNDVALPNAKTHGCPALVRDGREDLTQGFDIDLFGDDAAFNRSGQDLCEQAAVWCTDGLPGCISQLGIVLRGRQHLRQHLITAPFLLSSHRHVVEHRGTVLADTTRPKMLFETGLPPRYYLP